MDDKEVINELKVKEGIKHYLTFYDLDELNSENEITEGICTMNDLGINFRHAHVELKNKFDKQYENMYPNYENVLEELSNFTKKARHRLRILKSDKEKYKAEEGRAASLYDNRKKLKHEHEFLILKIDQFNSMIDLSLVADVGIIDDYISKMGGFIDEYFNLSGKLKFYCEEGYEELFGVQFKRRSNDMHGEIKLARLLKQKLLEKSEEDKESNIRENEEACARIVAENLLNEISLRCESLTCKVTVDLELLSDYQILEISQNKDLEFEFNGILERITSLAAHVFAGGEPIEDMLKVANESRSRLSEIRKKFQEKLLSIILERDVTPDKLKNAGDFQIDLPKFSGYGSKMDFFTFKSQFQKLVEPNVQKKFWVDFLKRNYLSGPALVLIEKETDYVRIWEKLFESYGNARLLLQNKLGDLDKLGGLWKARGEENFLNLTATLINSMKDLSFLAKEHNVEGQLYEGGGLEKVMALLGDSRHRRFRSKHLGDNLSKKDEWEQLLDFLMQELKFRERLVLDHKTAQLMGFSTAKSEYEKDFRGKPINEKLKFTSSTHLASAHALKCHICEKEGHVSITTKKGNTIIPYYVCELFVNMSPSDRYEKLKSKNLCTGCLYPGAFKGPKHKCFFTNYCCPNESHEDNERLHILLCDTHKRDDKNIKLFEKFREKFIKNCKVSLPEYSKHLSCFSEMTGVTKPVIGQSSLSDTFQSEPEICEFPIFQLQMIEVAGIKLNLFFDSGCGDMIIRKTAVEKLKSVGRVKQIVPGPLVISGVGDKKTVSEDGVYSLCLPLSNGKNAILSGVCLEKITPKFPVYNLGAVEKEIRNTCKQVDPKLLKSLPKLPKKIGGDTDILVGIKYAKYFPKLIFECNTGLGIYESTFISSDGTKGVVGGPHKEFTEVEEKFKGLNVKDTVYFEVPVRAYRASWKIEKEIPLIGAKTELNSSNLDPPICCAHLDYNSSENFTLDISDSDFGKNDLKVLGKTYANKRAPKCARQFDEIENSGTEINFRCVDCRSCVKCKNSARFDAISIQDEVEQSLIERAVRVEEDKCITVASLPFLVTDPDSRLVSNELEALKVYKRQIKTLNDFPQDRKAVIDFENKLQNLGFVDYLENLPKNERDEIISNRVKYFIPWLVVWNEKSLSTPSRMVFNGSQATRNGCSLNSLLAKGANSLNKLVEIVIRWTVHKHAFHTDISKMYNRVLLEKKFWRYQLYLWFEGLIPGEPPKWKVIKTLIYGLRSSGNLAECGLRRTAEMSKTDFPRAYDIVMHDTYVDDCISGTESPEITRQVTDELQVTLEKGGFSLKGFTFSGESPSESLSSDQESVLVAGLRWFPEGDFIKLNIKIFNFSKKTRGRKEESESGIIPKKLTKRDCVSAVSEVFDILGRVAPIIGGMKLDISQLHQRQVNWDDPIPNELKDVWAANFNVIQELQNIQFRRAIIPKNAVSLKIDTLNTADAGENLICAAIYARFELKNGKHSCQLIFARTKVIHDLTIPRAELVAAVLNASTGHVVRTSLQKYYRKGWNLTDSQVALNWINCVKNALKMWVRNRVIEITRLTDRTDWWHVDSENMIADLGTRKGAKISEIQPGSLWTEGHPWMGDDETKFPIRSVEEIVLSNKEKSLANKERIMEDLFSHNLAYVRHIATFVPPEVRDRYKFSNYILDPNKFRFRNVLRILALVFLFIVKCKKGYSFQFLKQHKMQIKPKIQGKSNCIIFPVTFHSQVNWVVVNVSDELIAAAKMYYFWKGTLEVEKFVDPSKYENNSVLRDGILYFTGRVLPMQEIEGRLTLGDACLDLSASSFFVPIIDSLSPIAYAIVTETHWYHPDVSHGGIESVLRISQSTAHIIGGRDLVKGIKKACIRCRILQKKGIKIAMGPIGRNNLCIAPAFYICQVDICGPFNAFSPVNKRATLKIYYVVFCCTVTGTVDCRVMESYATESFILAFVRFSCRFGYPKTVMPDEGSQLIKGCQSMAISFSDIKHKLNVEYGVNFQTCPVGAHYVHGKVERKIQEIKKSVIKNVEKNRLSVLQWETLGQQIANSINNMPIGLGNKTEMLENLDILTPNRLILGRNNNRNPTAPLYLAHDLKRIIESNNIIFYTWFREWLISYVPKLVKQPKWFITERNICVGDIVLFLKSEQEFDRQYQYGIVATTIVGRDDVVRVVEVEYQNHNENVKRRTKRGVRELVVIHPIEEIGISKELQDLARTIDLSV